MGNSLQGRNLPEVPGMEQVPKAFLDMLAATLRGGVKAIPGLPGDIEGLGRMGINYFGGEGTVDPKTSLPNTDDVGRWMDNNGMKLDPLVPLKGGGPSPYEKLGEFAPLPGIPEAAIQTAKLLRGGAKPLAQAATETTNLGRRDFLKKTGQGAGVLGAAVAIPGVASKLLREGAPLAGKAAELGTGARVAGAAETLATPIAKAVARGFTPEAVALATSNMRMINGLDEFSHLDVTGHTVEEAAKNFKNVDEMNNVDGWFEHWTDSGGAPDVSIWADDFDINAAKSGFFKDAHAAGIDPMQISTKGEYGSQIYSEAGKEIDTQRLTDQLNEKWFPSSRMNPEWVAHEKADDWFRANVTPAEVFEAAKKYPPGQVPGEWADRGVTPEMMAYRMAPIRGGPGGGPESGVETFMQELAADGGQFERTKIENVEGGQNWITPPEGKWVNGDWVETGKPKIEFQPAYGTKAYWEKELARYKENLIKHPDRAEWLNKAIKEAQDKLASGDFK